MENLFDYLRYIDLVTTTVDCGILFARERNKEIKEYQNYGEHKNKRITWVQI